MLDIELGLTGRGAVVLNRDGIVSMIDDADLVAMACEILEQADVEGGGRVEIRGEDDIRLPAVGNRDSGKVLEEGTDSVERICREAERESIGFEGAKSTLGTVGSFEAVRFGARDWPHVVDESVALMSTVERINDRVRPSLMDMADVVRTAGGRESNCWCAIDCESRGDEGKERNEGTW